MIQPDSIITVSESIKTLSTKAPSEKIVLKKVPAQQKVDSLSKADSISKTHSTAQVDTLRTIIAAPRGYAGISHPSLLQTDNWVFGILFFLFFLFVFSISRSAGLLKETFKTFLQVKERSNLFSNTTVRDFYTRCSFILFSVGVISFCAYIVLCQPSNYFSTTKYSCFFGITSAFFILKSVIIDLLGYVFLDRKSIKMAKQSYFNIVSFLSICLFPLLLIHIYALNAYSLITIHIGFVAGIMAGILVIIKLFQIFLHKTVASFYILLYLCTLEFLPLITLFWVYKLIALFVL